MLINKATLLALDVGERRIGVALGDSIGRLAAPLTTLQVDELELVRLQRLLFDHDVSELVVGLPRNMSGEETQQTNIIKRFVTRRLLGFGMPIRFQDESLTSVKAEQELESRKKPYSKSDVDALAATFILQDFMEAMYGY
jgi:putative Holliday junction resolvase